MPITTTLVQVTRSVARRAAHAIVHPTRTATDAATGAVGVAGTAAGIAQGTAAAVRDRLRDAAPGTATPTESPAHPTPAQVEPEVDPVEAADAVDPVQVVEPALAEDPAPPVATEPKPADIDDWEDELDDPAEPEGGLFAEPAATDEPLLDPSVAKSVRKETDTLRKAADRDAAGEGDSPADEVNGH